MLYKVNNENWKLINNCLYGPDGLLELELTDKQVNDDQFIFDFILQFQANRVVSTDDFDVHTPEDNMYTVQENTYTVQENTYTSSEPPAEPIEMVMQDSVEESTYTEEDNMYTAREEMYTSSKSRGKGIVYLVDDKPTTVTSIKALKELVLKHGKVLVVQA